MNQEILFIIKNMNLRSIGDRLHNKTDFISNLPFDYVEFMNLYDGAVGVIGNSDNYLDLWNVESIVCMNPYYPEEEFCKQIIIIGSNGGGLFYGYCLLEQCFFETDAFQMNREEMIRCGTTFQELLKHIES